jgi:hypothetical protein
MQLVCVAEVTWDHEVKLAESVKSRLSPGEKVRIKIEPVGDHQEQKRLQAIERLKAVSQNSRLGLL